MPTLDEFRAFYLAKVDGFNRRDWDALLEDLPEELEWHFPTDVVDRPTAVRPKELRASLEDLIAQFPDLRAEPREIDQETPDAFLVRLLVRGAGAASGAAIQLYLAQRWEFDGRKPVRVREFMP